MAMMVVKKFAQMASKKAGHLAAKLAEWSKLLPGHGIRGDATTVIVKGTEKDKDNDTQSPHVYGFNVGVALQHLGRQIVLGAQEGAGHGLLQAFDFYQP